jgi:hypothetical protein
LGKIYVSVSVPTAFVHVNQYSGKKTVDSGTTHGESKNYKASVLNMTRIGKCRYKNHQEKI